jgi:hypothetical protein
LTARQVAQQQLDAARASKQQLVFQRSQLNKRSQLYAVRAGGFDMMIAQAEEDINAAQNALDAATSVEGEE